MTTWTRQDLIEKLTDWQTGKMSTEEIHDWATDNWVPYEDQYEDHEFSEDGEYLSVTRDVLNYLEELFRLDITEEDVPELLNFLRTPKGQYEKGNKKMTDYFDSIDWDKRNEELKDRKPYSYWERRK